MERPARPQLLTDIQKGFTNDMVIKTSEHQSFDVFLMIPKSGEAYHVLSLSFPDNLFLSIGPPFC